MNELGDLDEIKNGQVLFKGLRICKSKMLPGNTWSFQKKKKRNQNSYIKKYILDCSIGPASLASGLVPDVQWPG